MLAVFVFVLALVLLGYAISSFARTQMQAMQLTFFFFLPSILLSGFMFPYRGMPGWAQALGEIFPLTHFIRAIRAVMLKGADLGAISQRADGARALRRRLCRGRARPLPPHARLIVEGRGSRCEVYHVDTLTKYRKYMPFFEVGFLRASCGLTRGADCAPQSGVGGGRHRRATKGATARGAATAHVGEDDHEEQEHAGDRGQGSGDDERLEAVGMGREIRRRARRSSAAPLTHPEPPAPTPAGRRRVRRRGDRARKAPASPSRAG